jgi:cold shock protein
MFLVEEEMATGTFTYFNAERGAGLIRPDDGGRDVLVHARDLVRKDPPLTANMRVTFDLVFDDKIGWSRAINVRTTA